MVYIKVQILRLLHFYVKNGNSYIITFYCFWKRFSLGIHWKKSRIIQRFQRRRPKCKSYGQRRWRIPSDDRSCYVAAPAYGVYISQLIRYSRACGSYQDFLDRGLLLTRKLLNQGFLLIKLKSSLGLPYGIIVSLITTHMLLPYEHDPDGNWIE
jgi:hypothetical protein